MAILPPQQPIPHQEAPPPPRPEVKAGQPQNARPLDQDDGIISKTRANLDWYAKIDSGKEVLAGTKQREQELAAQQQLQEVRQQLKNMQVGGKVADSVPEQVPTSGKASLKESTSKLSPEIIAEFKHYIYQGGLLIKQGKYAEAMVHFRNAGEPAKVGRQISLARSRIINKLPKPEEYGQLADSVAKNFWNKKDGGIIQLSNVDCYVTGPDGLPQKQAIPPGLQHEISLLYMEEWLHALQDIQGRPLTGEPDHEIDVAAYMEKNGIPMTEAFKRRYRRGEALEKAKQAKS